MDLIITVTVPADKKDAFLADFIVGQPIERGNDGQPLYDAATWVQIYGARLLNRTRNAGINSRFNDQVNQYKEDNQPPVANDAV